MRCINVVGSTGSGKTTMAKKLAQLLDIPRVELDAYRWDPHWTEAPDDVFRLRVAEAVKGTAWVVDGNYSITRDLIWPRVDTVVWLDYSFSLVFLRLTRRIFRRAISKEKLWNGNVKNGWEHFFSKDSLYIWLVRTHWRRRRQLVQLMSLPAYQHIGFVRLHSPRAARHWMATIPLATSSTNFAQ